MVFPLAVAPSVRADQNPSPFTKSRPSVQVRASTYGPWYTVPDSRRLSELVGRSLPSAECYYFKLSEDGTGAFVAPPPHLLYSRLRYLLEEHDHEAAADYA